MATKDYSLSAATATRLITKFGGAALLVTTTTSGGGPYTPGTPTETEAAVQAVIVDYTEREKAGTSIQAGDRRALITAPDGAAIPTTDTVLRFYVGSEAVNYQIANVNVIQPAGPGGLPVMFDATVRA